MTPKRSSVAEFKIRGTVQEAESLRTQILGGLLQELPIFVGRDLIGAFLPILLFHGH